MIVLLFSLLLHSCQFSHESQIYQATPLGTMAGRRVVPCLGLCDRGLAEAKAGLGKVQEYFPVTRFRPPRRGEIDYDQLHHECDSEASLHAFATLLRREVLPSYRATLETKLRAWEALLQHLLTKYQPASRRPDGRAAVLARSTRSAALPARATTQADLPLHSLPLQPLQVAVVSSGGHCPPLLLLPAAPAASQLPPAPQGGGYSDGPAQAAPPVGQALPPFVIADLQAEQAGWSGESDSWDFKERVRMPPSTRSHLHRNKGQHRNLDEAKDPSLPALIGEAHQAVLPVWGSPVVDSTPRPPPLLLTSADLHKEFAQAPATLGLPAPPVPRIPASPAVVTNVPPVLPSSSATGKKRRRPARAA